MRIAKTEDRTRGGKLVLDRVYQTVRRQMFTLSRAFVQHGLCSEASLYFSSHCHFPWARNLREDEKQSHDSCYLRRSLPKWRRGWCFLVLCCITMHTHREPMAYVLSESIRGTCFAMSGARGSPVAARSMGCNRRPSYSKPIQSPCSRRSMGTRLLYRMFE